MSGFQNIRFAEGFSDKENACLPTNDYPQPASLQNKSGGPPSIASSDLAPEVFFRWELDSAVSNSSKPPKSALVPEQPQSYSQSQLANPDAPASVADSAEQKQAVECQQS
ncbi:unnamed protein product [Protopolystoma xenopodis]|uniref:Uncharacterized protein n=1 Tax=Protopolystoma xenopodis TaxID=117903 RepID=A0A3S5BD27_9PLAT|nr:unnamed protein product [Protopolystoma xenopodis]